MPQESKQDKNQGGNEVLIGLSRRDLYSLLIIRRRLQEYAKGGSFVHPLDLEWVLSELDDVLGHTDEILKILYRRKHGNP